MHPVVTREEWINTRKAHLAEEKALTKAMDALHEKRRALPWVKVTEDYTFDTTEGKKKLGDLFKGRGQLIVYHFMLAPGDEEGCVGCSHLADHIDSVRQHIEHHDVMFAVISRASVEEIERFKKRMGWTFQWVSSGGSSFNYDFGVSFTLEQIASGNRTYNYEPATYPLEDLPGLSVFIRNETGEIFHTYSSYARGLDILLGTHNYLDLTPKGRNEEGNDGHWLRHHDKYGESNATCGCSH